VRIVDFMKQKNRVAWNIRSVFTVLLIALACCCHAFGEEIDDAARDGDLQKVKALIQANAELVSSKDEDGKTPLHWAAANGHKDVVEFLLENKADTRAKDNDGDTPYDLATFHKDEAEMLRQGGAANSSSTHDPAIFNVIRNGNLNKVKSLVEDDPGEVSIIDKEKVFVGSRIREGI
jgi:ankyrin repeat protein